MRGPGDILPRAAQRHGPRPALITDAGTLTFGELDARSNRVAAALAARGIGPGATVSLLSQNRWEWLVAYHGVLKAGAIVNPLNVMLTAEEVAYAARDCGAAALVVSGERAPEILAVAAELPARPLVVAFDDAPAGSAVPFAELLAAQGAPPDAPCRPDDVCTIGYTSGTTGRPKGALQSHRAVLLNCALTATMHVRTADDIVVTALPAAHVYGNVVLNGTWLAGGAVVLMERFDAGEALARIAEHRATLFEGVPTMYALMLAHPDVERADLSSLTRSTVGGQTIAVPVMDEWERRSGAPLLELWGMTELSGLGTTHALHAPNVKGSIGMALPGVQARVARLEDGAADAPPGEPGELMVRGPIVCLGYHGQPEATAELIEPDGWLHTGDVAYREDSGHFFVVDRLKDMIITSGYNVYPAEIERVLAEHPAVAMVAVGRRADEIKGERALAYVVPRPDGVADAGEILAYCRSRLAAYKVPEAVVFVDDLPKTSSGKVMRRALADVQPSTSFAGRA